MKRVLPFGAACALLLLSACTMLPVDAGPERDLAVIAKFEGQMRHSGLMFLEGREPIWTAPMQETPWTLTEFAINELEKNGEFVEGFEVVDQHIKALNGYFLAPVNPNGAAVVRAGTDTTPQKSRLIVITVPGTDYLVVLRCSCGQDGNDCDWVFLPENDGWRCSGAICDCAVEGIITHPDRGVIRF